MAALGTAAPDFELPDVVNGQRIRLSAFAEKKALLVMFICRHCPYVQHVKAGLTRFGKDYENSSLAIVAISSNDAKSYPDDAPAGLKEMALELKWTFPFCYDESQEIAKRYHAACTPDFFLYDERRCLVYRGQLDDARPGNNKAVTGKDLRSAVEAVLSGQAPSAAQKPSVGCNIKWTPGNEPR